MASGNAQTDTVADRLADSLVVHVRDAEGRSVEGAVVRWTSEDGGRLSPATDTTDAEGRAATRWTLGTAAGTVEAVAAAEGLSATFTALALHDVPRPPRRVAGDGQSAEVGTPLDSALVIRVADRYGNPVAGLAVSWTTEGGDGFMASPDSVTDEAGESRTFWMLPTAAGTFEATAVVGTNIVRFTATAEASEAVAVERLDGDELEAPAGELVADSPAVRLTDRFGNPVAGVAVYWTVGAGGGTVEPAVDTTDAEGVARAAWRLGAAGDQILVAQTADGLGAHFTASLGLCDVGDPDTDGDGLPDCAESGTHVYRAWYDAGTDPANPDTDGDGIPDGDEALGTAGGLDLPALGVSPLRRDLLLEHDWVEDATDCEWHSHEPPAEALEEVRRMFAEAPTMNPDGTMGVNVIQDVGQGGVFTGGGAVETDDGMIDGGVLHSEYAGYREDHMAPERRGYVHYVLHVHRYGTPENGSSGQATLKSDRVIVALGCAASQVRWVSNTLAHEVGHNLGLRHGGNETLNYKPNYNSVMNYRYQFGGVDTDCDAEWDVGLLAFSSGARPPLDENALDERDGVCPGAGIGIDWNNDGDTEDTALAWDINASSIRAEGDGQYGVLNDHDDWAALYFPGPAAGASAGDRALAYQRAEPELPVCQPVPSHFREAR